MQNKYSKKRTIFERQEFKHTVNDGNNDGNSQQIRICVKKSLLQRQMQMIILRSTGHIAIHTPKPIQWKSN